MRDSGWMLPGIGALVAYTVFVLPSIFVLGPVLAEQSLDGATVVGDHLDGVRHRRRRSAACSPTACGSSARSSRASRRCCVACSQGAIIASGLGRPGDRGRSRRVAGIGVSLFFTLWDLTVQQQVPPEATARVSAYDWAAAAGLMPIGLLISGPIAATIGLETTMRARHRRRRRSRRSPASPSRRCGACAGRRTSRAGLRAPASTAGA